MLSTRNQGPRFSHALPKRRVLIVRFALPQLCSCKLSQHSGDCGPLDVSLQERSARRCCPGKRRHHDTCDITVMYVRLGGAWTKGMVGSAAN